MKKTMTLVEAREMFGETCYETETSFLVNVFGKYCPNITFVVGKEIELDANGKSVDPLHYYNDREVTDSMNMEFDGDAEFMFGDFWRSKKGGACFRPKDPKVAKDLLVRVSWGGCFNGHRGTYSDEANAIEGVKYFRRASSNGGRAGYDYWVMPVGFSRILHIDEVDGETKLDHTAEFERRAKAYREKHAKLQREASESNDKAYKAKLAAEEESRQAKAGLVTRLEAVKERLVPLNEFFGEHCWGRKTFEILDSYFKIEYTQYLYTEENVCKAEQWVADQEQLVTDTKIAWAARDAAKVEFESSFLALEARFVEIGWRMETTSSEKAKVFEPYERYWNCRTYHEEREHDFAYSGEGFKACTAMLESKEAEIREKRETEEAAERLKKAQEEAKALGLPSNIRLWHRSGATNAGEAWVISSKGMDRECDSVDTSVCGSNSKRYHQSYEGNHVWDQVMPGELVIYWSHAYTAAPHEFQVIYRPETLTEAQLERVAEIQNGIEERFFGKSGLTGTSSCPSIGQGWGLFHREESVIVDDEDNCDEQSDSGSGATLGDVFEKLKKA